MMNMAPEREEKTENIVDKRNSQNILNMKP